MAVEGTIGGQPVILNNAATESTLDKIYKILSSTISSEKLKEIFESSSGAGGVSNAAVKEFVQETGKASKIAAGLGGALGGLDSAADTYTKTLSIGVDVVSQFTNNLGNASGLFGMMARQEGIVGALGRTFQIAAEFNEQQLKSYQDLTTAGINFGGSLGDLRTSAAAMELSMDSFVSLMKNNSEAFAKMGGSANVGAQNFKNLSQAMFAGDAGNKLKNLGYTSEQVNQSMLNYIAFTGGRNAQQMQDTDKLSKSASHYMQNMDALATITGKSREQQEEAMKEAAANAAFESYLMTLDEDQRAKAMQGMQDAFAKGGKGAQEAFMSAAQGFPPMTKAAQQFTAIAGPMNDVTMKQVAAIKDSTVTVKESQRIGTEYNAASVKVKNDLGQTGNAIVAMGGELSGAVTGPIKTANMVINQGADSNKKAISQLDRVLQEQEERGKSSAATQVKIQDSMRKAGEALLTALVPLAETMLPLFEGITSAMANFLTWLDTIPGAFEVLGLAIGGLVVAFAAAKIKLGFDAGLATIGEAFGGGKGGGGKGGGGGGIPGAGKVGDDIGKLTKGAGPGAGGVLEGLSKGLASFGGPQAGGVITGSLALAGAIAILSVGIGVGAVVLGKTLPFLAEGLKAFGEVDGANLVAVGLGVGALGVGLVALAAGQLTKGGVDLLEGLGKMFGGQTTFDKLKDFASIGPELELAGKGLTAFTKALADLSIINTDKLDKVSVSMAKLGQSIPRPNIADMAGEFLVNLTKPLAMVAEAIIPGGSSTSSNNNNIDGLIGVNTQMLAVMKDLVKQNKDVVSAIKKLNPNLFN